MCLISIMYSYPILHKLQGALRGEIQCPICTFWQAISHSSNASTPASMGAYPPGSGCPGIPKTLKVIIGLPLSLVSTAILLVADFILRMCSLVLLLGLPSAVQSEEYLLNQVFCLFEMPCRWVSDGGVQFTSRVWQPFCSQLGVSTLISTVWPTNVSRAVQLSQGECTCPVLVIYQQVFCWFPIVTVVNYNTW